ncbi:class I SAM-dependent methyltransferase [Streptomyces sp. NPDC037389]|uniref:class I SAM-dependent methyltransferase n=1 Tax=Streptomyces sp. NPDC037389 TaxID=3155369 RepID=UPI0033DDF287
MDASVYKSEVAAAFDRASAAYDRAGVEFFTPMGRRLVDRVAPLPGERVLDVGCGRGACVFPAAERVGPAGTVVGIDIAPGMIEEAVKEAERRGVAGRMRLRVMDGERPDFPAESFDVVTGSYSVIFFPDAPAALSRYARLLTAGGRIGFTSPVFTDDTFPFLPPVFTGLIPRELLRSLPPEWRPERLRERFNSWLADPADLTRTMEACGFRGVECVDENVRLVAASGAAWVEWSYTQGMRLLWEHLGPAEREALRERLVVGLDALRVAGGPVVIDTPVRYVTATTR